MNHCNALFLPYSLHGVLLLAQLPRTSMATERSVGSSGEEGCLLGNNDGKVLRTGVVGTIESTTLGACVGSEDGITLGLFGEITEAKPCTTFHLLRDPLVTCFL